MKLEQERTIFLRTLPLCLHLNLPGQNRVLGKDANPQSGSSAYQLIIQFGYQIVQVTVPSMIYVRDEQPFVHRSWPPSASRIRAALAVPLSVCLYRNCNAMAHPEFYHRGRPRRPSGVPILVEAECASTGGMAALLWTGRWMPGFAFFSKLVLKQKQADFI